MSKAVRSPKPRRPAAGLLAALLAAGAVGAEAAADTLEDAPGDAPGDAIEIVETAAFSDACVTYFVYEAGGGVACPGPHGVNLLLIERDLRAGAEIVDTLSDRTAPLEVSRHFSGAFRTLGPDPVRWALAPGEDWAEREKRPAALILSFAEDAQPAPDRVSTLVAAIAPAYETVSNGAGACVVALVPKDAPGHGERVAAAIDAAVKGTARCLP